MGILRWNATDASPASMNASPTSKDATLTFTTSIQRSGIPKDADPTLIPQFFKHILWKASVQFFPTTTPFFTANKRAFVCHRMDYTPIPFFRQSPSRF